MHKQLGKGFTHMFIEDARPDKFAAVRGNSPIETRYEREKLSEFAFTTVVSWLAIR